MYERSGYDWGSLGTWWGSDPIPGSPDVLERCAADYRSSEQNLARAVENLRNLRSTDQTRSEAVEKIMASAAATAGSLDQVRERYDTISRALTGYAPELREAQSMSIRAVNQASVAAKSRAAALQRNDAARFRSVTVDQAVRDQALAEYHQSKADYLRADVDVESAKTLLAQAIARRDKAGESAKSLIAGEINGSSLNDTVGDYFSAAWEAIKKATASMLKFIWEHIDEICLVLDILSVVLALTGVGGPVAALLQVVSKAARVAHLISKIKTGVQLLYAAYTGFTTGDWGKFVGQALTLGMNYGIGKVLGKAGGKVGKWVQTRIDFKNAKLITKTTSVSDKVLRGTIDNGNPVSTIIKKMQAGTALQAYHPAAPSMAKLFASNNFAAQAVAPKVQAALSLMKGTDYAKVSPYVAQLTKLAGKSTISDALAPKLVAIGSKGAADTLGYLTGKVTAPVGDAAGKAFEERVLR